MKKSFPEHFPPDGDTLKELWDNAFFAFDTNVLLRIYEFDQETAMTVMSAIEKIPIDRRFLPHQVTREFLRLHKSVIRKQGMMQGSLVTKIKDAQQE